MLFRPFAPHPRERNEHDTPTCSVTCFFVLTPPSCIFAHLTIAKKGNGGKQSTRMAKNLNFAILCSGSAEGNDSSLESAAVTRALLCQSLDQNPTDSRARVYESMAMRHVSVKELTGGKKGSHGNGKQDDDDNNDGPSSGGSSVARASAFIQMGSTADPVPSAKPGSISVCAGTVVPKRMFSLRRRHVREENLLIAPGQTLFLVNGNRKEGMLSAWKTAWCAFVFMGIPIYCALASFLWWGLALVWMVIRAFLSIGSGLVLHPLRFLGRAWAARRAGCFSDFLFGRDPQLFSPAQRLPSPGDGSSGNGGDAYPADGKQDAEASSPSQQLEAIRIAKQWEAKWKRETGRAASLCSEGLVVNPADVQIMWSRPASPKKQAKRLRRGKPAYAIHRAAFRGGREDPFFVVGPATLSHVMGLITCQWRIWFEALLCLGFLAAYPIFAKTVLLDVIWEKLILSDLAITWTIVRNFISEPGNIFYLGEVTRFAMTLGKIVLVLGVRLLIGLSGLIYVAWFLKQRSRFKLALHPKHGPAHWSIRWIPIELICVLVPPIPLTLMLVHVWGGRLSRGLEFWCPCWWARRKPPTRVALESHARAAAAYAMTHDEVAIASS